MDREQFTEELVSHWPKTTKGVIKSVQNKLSFYSDRDINDIWNLLKDSYCKTTAPNYADILNIIKTNNIDQVRGEVHKRHYVYICLDCGEVYADKQEPLVAACCPVCMSEHRTIAEYDAEHHKVTTYQYQCFISDNSEDKSYMPAKCLMYGQSGSYGPMCKHWGRKQTDSECRSCICQPCCIKQINMNKAEYNRIKNIKTKTLDNIPV